MRIQNHKKRGSRHAFENIVCETILKCKSPYMKKLNILTVFSVVLALTSSCSSTKVGELGKSGLIASKTRPFDA